VLFFCIQAQINAGVIMEDDATINLSANGGPVEEDKSDSEDDVEMRALVSDEEVTGTCYILIQYVLTKANRCME